MPTLEQLEVFVAAAEKGSFSAAARHVGKGQSTVSLAISNLEIDLGNELFDRSTRKPRLTDEGTRLLDYARATLQQMRQLLEASDSLADGSETRITLALDDALHLAKVDETVLELGMRYPATELELLVLPSSEVPQQIRSRRADIGLMFSTQKVQLGIAQTFIGNLPFVAVSSPEHPLASVRQITASDLLAHRQLMQRHADKAQHVQFPRLSPNIWTATSFWVIRQQICHGTGWAYMPEHMVKADLSAGRLVRLNLRFEYKKWSPAVEVVTKKNAQAGPVMDWLQSHLKDSLG